MTAMTWFYRTLARPVLFLEEAETAHGRTLAGLARVSESPLLCDAVATFLQPEPLPVECFGLHFPNPVGLAAGMDKLAEAVPAWEALGFGFTELGGVTWHGQPGNPPSRIFRAIPDEAIVNRMGFNNPGAESVAATLDHWHRTGRWPRHPVGINLGKSKVTPLAEAAEDYTRSFRALWPQADFFVVNVSSPNTPNLRQLQDRDALDGILAALQAANAALAAAAGRNARPKPILVKVAPDLTFEALDDILALAGPRNLAGLVATNTTLARPESEDASLRAIYAEGGGLSGRPLRARSTEVIRHLFRQSGGRVPIMGVGGIFTAADAWEKITAGASLVQVYTGLVYEGPSMVKAMVDGLRERLREERLERLDQAVGIAARGG